MIDIPNTSCQSEKGEPLGTAPKKPKKKKNKKKNGGGEKKEPSAGQNKKENHNTNNNNGHHSESSNGTTMNRQNTEQGQRHKNGVNKESVHPSQRKEGKDQNHSGAQKEPHKPTTSQKQKMNQEHDDVHREHHGKRDEKAPNHTQAEKSSQHKRGQTNQKEREGSKLNGNARNIGEETFGDLKRPWATMAANTGLPESGMLELNRGQPRDPHHAAPNTSGGTSPLVATKNNARLNQPRRSSKPIMPHLDAWMDSPYESPRHLLPLVVDKDYSELRQETNLDLYDSQSPKFSKILLSPIERAPRADLPQEHWAKERSSSSLLDSASKETYIKQQSDLAFSKYNPSNPVAKPQHQQQQPQNQQQQPQHQQQQPQHQQQQPQQPQQPQRTSASNGTKTRSQQAKNGNKPNPNTWTALVQGKVTSQQVKSQSSVAPSTTHHKQSNNHPAQRGGSSENSSQAPNGHYYNYLPYYNPPSPSVVPHPKLTEKARGKLTDSMKEKLNNLLNDTYFVQSKDNKITLQITMKDFLKRLKDKMPYRHIYSTRDGFRLVGSAASLIVDDKSFSKKDINDLDFSIYFQEGPKFIEILQLEEEVLAEIVREQTGQELSPKDVFDRFLLGCIKIETNSAPKEAWNLITFGKPDGPTIDIKFIFQTRRCYVFSTDSFEIILDPLFSKKMGHNISAESLYGNYSEAINHLKKGKLCADRPQEVRRGIFRYCYELSKGRTPLSEDEQHKLDSAFAGSFYEDRDMRVNFKDILHKFLLKHRQHAVNCLAEIKTLLTNYAPNSVLCDQYLEVIKQQTEFFQDPNNQLEDEDITTTPCDLMLPNQQEENYPISPDEEVHPLEIVSQKSK